MTIQETIETTPHTGVLLIDRAGIPDAMELTATNDSVASYVTRFRDDAWPDAQYLLLLYGLRGWVYWVSWHADDLKRDVMRLLDRLPGVLVPWFSCGTDETRE